MTIKELRKILDDLVPLIGEEAEVWVQDCEHGYDEVPADDWKAQPGRLVLR